MAENSGLFVNYYLAKVDNPQREDQPPYQAECEDIILALGMNFDEGTLFKEIWRSCNARKGFEKQGHTSVRSGEKIFHYARRIHKQRIIENEIQQQREHSVTPSSMAGDGRVRLYQWSEEDICNLIAQADKTVHLGGTSTTDRT